MNHINAGDKPKKVRSKVTNKTRLFLGDVAVDGRSKLARRFADHIDDLVSQIGGDPTPAQLAIIRNAACLAVLTEIDQAKLVSGQDVDDAVFIRRVETLRKLLWSLGLHRRARDVSPAPKGPVIDAHAASILEASDD